MSKSEVEPIHVRCWPAWLIWVSIVWWSGISALPWLFFYRIPLVELSREWNWVWLFAAVMFHGVPFGLIVYSLYALMAANIRADASGLYYLRWNGWRRIPWVYVVDWYTEVRHHNAEGISYTDTILTILYRDRRFRTSRLSITHFDDLQDALYQYGTKNAGALPPYSNM